VQIDDAVALIRSAVEGHGGLWLELGAGRGTFTRALSEVLGTKGTVLAVDRDPDAIDEIARWAAEEKRQVDVLEQDFEADSAFASNKALDGILCANSLHFVKDPGSVLGGFVPMLRPGGRVVIVEYDRRAASRWVPHPISIASLGELAKAAGLSKFRVVESRPSNYEGIIYCAVAERDGHISGSTV
jgi:ubiquinone/menaquinone biosynthesis C-methylase UbiE